MSSIQVWASVPSSSPRSSICSFRAPDPADRSQGGLGLGLALVQKLVRLHDGSVSAHSEGLGKGSRFRVRLPISHLAPSPLPADTRELTVSSVAEVSSRRILLVDDNADAVDILRDMLVALGHEVVAAYDGPQALLALERFAADIAVVDIELPVMDGYELAQRIRTGEGWRIPRLIAITGNGQATNRARSYASGFGGHLVKPVDVTSLLAACSEDRGPTTS